MSGGPSFQRLSLKISSHALGWLVLGNAIGILLSLQLLWPSLNTIMAPFTYGRWVPLHLDFQLYGWCSFPLLALLFHFYLRSEKFSMKWAGALITLWSTVLALGGWEWLHGRNSGKIFLDWSGFFGLGFPLVMGLVWMVLAMGYIQQIKNKRPPERTMLNVYAKGFFLLILAVIPFAFIKVLNPAVYPAINKASGGPTGTSLLGSTLGVVSIFWLLPLFGGIASKRSKKPALIVGGLLAIHFALFGLLPHGNIAFGSPSQVLALGSTLAWIPILKWYFSTFHWPSGSRKWLASFGAWGFVLCATGFALFFSGMLGRWKYTSVLVAHSHLAMAGMMSSFNILILVLMNRLENNKDLFGSRLTFVLWHGGLIIHLIALAGIAYEGGHFSEYPSSHPIPMRVLQSVKLMGGILMLTASVRWFANARRAVS